MGNKPIKGRHFEFILYPESCLENWVEILKDSKLPILVSPLHDRDINDDGEYKKAHYHVLFSYNNTQTLNQAKLLCESVGGTHTEVIKHFPNSVAYLVHKNNPEKAQYSPNDVLCLNGANFENSLPKAEGFEHLNVLMRLLDENDIRSLYELIVLVQGSGDTQLMEFCINKAYFVRSLIQDSIKFKAYHNDIELFNATRCDVNF